MGPGGGPDLLRPGVRSRWNPPAIRCPPPRRLVLPALVVHGGKDRVFRRKAGEATAAALSARLVVFEEMGHALPGALFGPLVEEVARLVPG